MDHPDSIPMAFVVSHGKLARAVGILEVLACGYLHMVSEQAKENPALVPLSANAQSAFEEALNLASEALKGGE